MAPVNPAEILDAFSPLLTDAGGIKKVDESQFLNLLSMMKNCSTKLVSRCIFCQILMSTSADVLEEFLKIGVWNLIAAWVKTSKDDGSVAFLLELLKLLHTLPMNIDRLRENECPKIVKKLCKHDNEEIAQKANQIIKKWTKIITGTSSSSPGNLKDKKRKAESNSSSSSNESSKKAKSSSAKSESSNGGNNGSSNNNNNNPSSEAMNVLNDADSYETFSRDDMNKFMVNTTKESKPRPVTVKVKPGKFRLDLTASSSSSGGKVNSKKKPTDMKDNKANDSKKLPTRKTSSGSDTLKVPDRSTKSSLVVSTPTTPPVIKDSISFMDALSVMPVVNKKRRKLNKDENSTTNKLSHSQEVKVERPDESTSNHNNNNNNTNTSTPTALLSFGSTNHDASSSNSIGTSKPISGPQILPKVKSDLEQQQQQESSINTAEALKSPPRFSFYKDILEETKSEEETATSQCKVQSTEDDGRTEPLDDSETPQSPPEKASTNANTTDDLSWGSGGQMFEVKVSDGANDTLKLKPILNYIKKGSKKSVRWPDDDKDLEKVKYFELDETERINVTRPQNADMTMKRSDMKHEAQLWMEAKKKCTTYSTWKLIPIYVDPENVPVEKGINSQEREIQAKAMETTLECFYMPDQIPDSAIEPDPKSLIFADSTDQPQPKIIPLEDENAIDNKVQDYSSISIAQPSLSTEPNPTNFDYNSSNNGPFPSATEPFQPAMPTNQFPPPTNHFQVPPNVPNNNYTSPPANFDAPSSNNFPYNNNSNYPNVPPNPPMYNLTPGAFNQSDQFNSNFGVGGPMNNAMNQSPPNMFNANQPPNYFNTNQGPPPPVQHPPANDNAYNNNSYWPESNNFNNGPGNQFQMPTPHPGPHGGPRFRGHRGGRGGRGGFHPKGGGNDGICRFYLKTGHCKFGARCNFSHVVDGSKRF